uniref:YifB family Mg chelatase-like AAA ATPase n=1 Tax=Agathobacter sp. TaxID=2021311 RepID=UPI0040562110
MYSTIKTAILEGIHTKPIQVEVDISNGMPAFDMVGHLSQEVKEGKDRVRTALHSLGIALPPKRITMNLSPANLKKCGNGFDVPMAAALLLSLGLVDKKQCEDKLFVGELSLNGQILPVNGILPIVSDACESGIRNVIVPKENENEANLVKKANVYAFSHLKEMVGFLNGKPYEKNVRKPEEILVKPKLDFCEVNGQTFLKRACEIAASGMHNMLLVGPPGAGKTMISERMSTILPPLTEEECLELSKIYSVCGLLTQKTALLSNRPFRAPHHTITKISLSGGGRIPKPGEISLAHKGVLFLDELTEFQKDTLDVLRQPLEEHEIRLARVDSSVTYPADFLLLAAMNPCNCGYYPDMQRCRCSQASRRRYLERVSQPLIDRMDICVQASSLSYAELTGKAKGETSAAIQKRVLHCHEIQRERYKNQPFSYNSHIPAGMLNEFCALGEKEQHYMEYIYEKMALTGRTYHKILRVARTIADLEEAKGIKLKHLNEAICYRSVDLKYWGGM